MSGEQSIPLIFRTQIGSPSNEIFATKEREVFTCESFTRIVLCPIIIVEFPF